MRKRIVLIMAIACVLLIIGCGASNSAEDPAGTDNQIKVTYVENAEQTDAEENIATDGVADYPAAIMVNDTVYLMEGDPMPAEVDESAIIGYTESYTGTFPENNGETNFNPELGMPYAQVEGGIAVLYKNEWYLGTPFSNENTITFTGIIIDHTVESLVPVICVKTLNEEVIPYETVFFELPEGEEDWMLKIDAEVFIACSGGFTESAPHFGTLISITDVTTEADNSLSSFTKKEIGEAKQAALVYYDDTVFTVNSIEYFNGDLPYGGDEDCCNFTVNVSKDGVMQEPDRTISLKLYNGIWEVVNEGY